MKIVRTERIQILIEYLTKNNPAYMAHGIRRYEDINFTVKKIHYCKYRTFERNLERFYG